MVMFATDEARQRSQRRFISVLKLTLLPTLTLFGFTLGALFVQAGRPEEFGWFCSLVLGPGLPWVALQALNRRLQFWFVLGPGGLGAGPGGDGWNAAYEEVAFIQESHLPDGEASVKVLAGPHSATVVMSPDDAKNCVKLLLARCPCAVRVDASGGTHLPKILERDPNSKTGRRAVENLAVVRDQFILPTLVFGGLFLACLVALAWIAAALTGFILAEGNVAWAIPGCLLFGVSFGLGLLSSLLEWLGWERLRSAFRKWDGEAPLLPAPPEPIEALEVDATVLPEAEPAAGSEVEVDATPLPESEPEAGVEVGEPRTAWALTGAQRFFLAVRVYVFWTAVAFFLGFMVSRFWLFPEEPSRRRYDLILVLASAVGTLGAVRGYARAYHAVSVDPDALRLCRGEDCEEIPYPAVVGLIGRGSFGFDGDGLVDWRRLLIVTEDRRRLLAFSPGDCAALYRALLSRCPRAWGVPFRGRLERPKTAGFRVLDGRSEDDLVRLAQVYSQQIAKAVGLRLAAWVGGTALFDVLRVDGKIEDGAVIGMAWFGACVVLWVTLVAGLFRDVRHMKEMRRASAGSMFE